VADHASAEVAERRLLADRNLEIAKQLRGLSGGRWSNANQKLGSGIIIVGTSCVRTKRYVVKADELPTRDALPPPESG
jgi:hypothetical protein